MLDNEIKEFVKKLEFTNGKYNVKKIFTDVVALAVCVIQFGILGNEDYRKQYDTILQSYTEKEQVEIQVIVLELAELYNKQKEPVDIMTHIFGELGLGNKDTGQFFTPTQVSDMMTKIVVEENGIEQDIKEKGYITMHEPTCGAGRYDIIICKTATR